MEKKMMKSNGAGSRSSAMKRRRLLSAAAVLLICCLVFIGAAGAADGYTDTDGLSYSIVSDTAVKVVDGKACTGDIAIPEKVMIDGKEYTVTEIAANAFNDANEVTSVVVPNSVTTLGGAAFANMDKLISIRIGNGVTTWGSKLAVNNYELTTVVIDEGATLIGDLAFRTCPKLVSVTLPSTLEKIGGTAFAYSAIEELTIPASVTTIGADAFKDIDTLKTVRFNSAPANLGTTVFQMCDGLETVNLPDGLTSIPQGTFRYCTALKNIIFPESLKIIDNYAFQGCTSLESIKITKEMTLVDTLAFNGCTGLKTLVIEDGVKNNGLGNNADIFGQYVFQGCTALESVVIPSSMKNVGESMFNGCTSLESVTLREGVEKLDISAFSGCAALNSLIIPDSVVSLRHGSIANCANLRTLIIVGSDLPAIEHSNALNGLPEDIVVVYNGDNEFTGNWAALAGNGKKGNVIIFETNGGSVVDSITQNYGTDVTAPADPIKDGYTFAGWDKNIPSIMPDDYTTTITASWTPNTYSVTFDANGGEGTMADQPFTYDVEQSLSALNFAKIGYTFNGWNTAEDGSGTEYTNAQLVKNLTTENYGVVTLYAQWDINEYTITFETDGGSAVESITQNYGTDVTAPADPIKDGYTFAGWDREIPATMPAENIVINALWDRISSTSSGSSSGSYFSFPRTTENGGLIDFGSSKVVKALMLPEGSSGSVLLKVDTIEKWPKALETEYTFDISVEKLGDGMAYIHFEIPVSVLESLELTPADICAYHFEGEVWTKLPTTYEVKDGTVCYEAATDSFSPFKLVIEEGAATQKEEENVPTVPPTEEPDVPDEPEILPPIDEPTEPTEPETPAPILAVLAGLGAAFIVRRK